MLVKRAEMIGIECVARGYLSGSGWKGIPRTGHGLRHSAARGAAGKRQAARTDLHSFHQSGERSRRKYFVRSHDRAGGCRIGCAPPRSHSGPL